MGYRNFNIPSLSNLVKLFSILAALLISNVVAGADFSVMRWRNIVVFSGKLTKESVAEILVELKRDSTEKLVINSSGGNAAAAMQLGRAIRELSLNIEVQGLCTSSCANYVFPAGNRKRVAEGGLVTWHGGALQSDFRQLVEKYRLITGLPNNELTAEQKAWLKANAVTSQLLLSAQQEQTEFFNAIGLDERITRLGQEPVDLGPSWTVTADTMKAFGILNVELPPDYDTSDYVKRWSRQRGLTERVVLLRVDPKTGEVSVVGAP